MCVKKQIVRTFNLCLTFLFKLSTITHGRNTVGEVTIGIGFFQRLLPQRCGDTTRWSTDGVVKALFNAIQCPMILKLERCILFLLRHCSSNGVFSLFKGGEVV